MVKKIILIIIVIVLGVGGYGYWNQSREVAPPPPTDFTFFPTGEDRIFLATSTATNTGQMTLTSQLDEPAVKLSDRAVVSVFNLGTASSSLIAYVEKATGHIYEARTDGSTNRLFNSTIPGVMWVSGSLNQTEAKIIISARQNGQTNNQLGSFSLNGGNSGDSFIAGTSTERAITLKPLDNSALWPVIAPGGEQWAHLNTQAQESQVIINGFSTSSPIAIYSSPLTEWVLNWVSPTFISLQTKPDSTTVGVLLALNPKTRVSERLIGGVPGLETTLSPDTNTVVYSGSTGQGIFLARFHRPSQAVTRLPVQTLAKKCTWAPDSIHIYCAVPKNVTPAGYPEAWYQGKISFNDNFWKINTQTNEAAIVLNPELANIRESLDANSLVVNQDESRLFFINKTDNTLWSIRLTQGF